MIEKYYLNWSPISGNYLVKEVGEGKIIQIFQQKSKAEKFIKEKEEHGQSTKREW